MKKFGKSKNDNEPKKQKKEKEQKPYVMDEGRELSSKEMRQTGIGMILIAVILGFIGGFVVWGAFLGSMLLTDLLWKDGVDTWRASLEASGIPSWWLPVTITTLGGLLIGLWTKYTGAIPSTMEAVTKKVKKDGKYLLKRPFAFIVGFLMPLVFGGTIGPEAGLTALMSHASSAVGAGLRRFGIKSKDLVDVSVSAAATGIFANPLVGIVAARDSLTTNDLQDSQKKVDPYQYDLKRAQKLILYILAAAASLLGAYTFSAVSGGEFGFPRFEGLIPGSGSMWIIIVCLVLGYLGGICYNVSALVFRKFERKLKGHPIIKPVICGLILGILAIWFPMVMFPGEEQLFELQEDWFTWPVALLFATGFLKCACATMCLNMGWKGGGIFPMVYSGAAIGYAISMVSGVDPMFTVSVTSAILVAASLRKIPMAIALMFLAFPPSTVAFTLVACVLGCVLPMPGEKACKRMEEEDEAELEALEQEQLAF